MKSNYIIVYYAIKFDTFMGIFSAEIKL